MKLIQFIVDKDAQRLKGSGGWMSMSLKFILLVIPVNKNLSSEKQ